MSHGWKITGTLAAAALAAVLGAVEASSQTTYQTVQTGTDQPGVTGQPAHVASPAVVYPGRVEGWVTTLDETSRARPTLRLDGGTELSVASVTPAPHEILRPGSYVSAVVENRGGVNVITDLRIEPELQAP
jgi:hypothetical protein